MRREDKTRHVSRTPRTDGPPVLVKVARRLGFAEKADSPKGKAAGSRLGTT